MATDETLLNEFKSNRLDSFYECVYPSLLMFAAANLTPKFSFLAEDCVQDAIFSAYRKRQDFYSFSSLKSYIYTCIKNAVVSILRKDKAGSNYKSGIASTAVSSANLNDEIEAQEIHRAIFNALDELPQIYRDTFELSFVDGLSNAEVAQRLGISVSAVKKRKASIKLHLHEELKGELPKLISFFLYISWWIAG